MDYPRHTEQVTFFDSDKDFLGRVSAARIFDVLQRGATAHAALLGVGMTDLMKDGHSWMISAMSVELLKQPEAMEPLTLTTWPSGVKKRVVCTRDYEITDASGAVVARAVSDWIYVDVENRKICMLTPQLASLAPEGVPRADVAPGPKAIEKTGEHHSAQVLVRRSDTDINRHVNNVHYVEWLFEAMPEEVYARNLVRLDITYRQEAMPGDAIESEVWIGSDGATTFHALTRTADGAVVATARCIWR